MVNQSDAVIVQNQITGNSAGCGGGIRWLVPSGTRGPFLVNNTIADNIGSGVYAEGFDTASQLTNNLIVARAGETALFCPNTFDSQPPIIRFNDVFSPSGAAYAGICPDLTGIDGNISADPLFVSASTRNYHIGELSPAVDAGDNSLPNLPATDIDGNPRIQDGDRDGVAIVDMGVDEFTPLVAMRDGRQSAFLSDLSLSDDAGHGLLPLPNSQPLLRHWIHEVGSDNHVTVFAYDAAGYPIMYIDATGVKKDAGHGRSRLK